ncbi:hypothetical protein SAVCW2_35250 [Streptomyces avermitilis]|nr:hypothetical protein SAVCW2_35250 [Streptomyces avermitilis]
MIRLGAACLTALVSASWTTRKAVVSMSGGSGRTSPVVAYATGTPLSDTRRTSAASSARTGCGRRGPEPSSRSTPSIRRSCVMASLPVPAMASNAASARSGAVRTDTGPASAWTTIRATECDSTSCISRAMRARSRAAAWSASTRVARNWLRPSA